MGTGGRRTSKHTQPRTGWTPLTSALAMVLGAAISGLAWVYLVRSAIDFGLLARDGRPLAWVFTGAASLGAVVCALLVLVLVTRTLRTLGLIKDYKPRRAGARKRAK